MTAAAPATRQPFGHRIDALRSSGRLLGIELRHSAMLWLVPLAAVLFWYSAYRPVMAMPPLWSLRAPTMQHDALLDFVLPVVGAACWMGSRETRRGVVDLAAIAARPRWIRQLTAWAAVTVWALAGYVICVGVLYAVTAGQASWGGPLWWPAVVGAAGLPALAAVGFAAGAWFPSRFTTPLVSVAAFFFVGLSAQFAHGGASLWQVSPIIPGAVDIGPDPGVATFYPYLPDLPIAQLIFAAGLAAAVIGALGMPAGSGGRRVRIVSAGIAATGVIAASTALGLVSTAKLDRHGMMIVPALHNAASDRPIKYQPLCGQTAIAVCLNPVFAQYMPTVTSALRPVLKEVAGLPGAPKRIIQSAPTFTQISQDGIQVRTAATVRYVAGAKVLVAALPNQLPGERQPDVTLAQYASQVRAQLGDALVGSLVGSGGGQAQQAVRAGLLIASGVRLIPPGERGDGLGMTARGPKPGSPVYQAARRFAALPGATRHAWLSTHLAALKAGRLTLKQVP
ncbi:MAG: hypothetical protein LBV34_26900 [Nocardiopsaceae bacterium]|jgi:hypothetical protein|nr:hypothetical protein [Nocardiopsaceae bacterium]